MLGGNNNGERQGYPAAGHVPGVGKVLGIHDTVQKGRRLVNSTPRAINALQRRARANISRRIRKFL